MDRMVRKWIGCGLAIFLCWIYVWSPARTAAETASDSFRLAASRTAPAVGETFSVTVEGRNLTDMYGNEVTIAYDAAKLDFVSASHHFQSGANTDIGYSIPAMAKDGAVVLAHTLIGQMPAITGDKTLYTLTFQAKRKGNTAIALSGVRLVGSGSDAVYPAVLEADAALALTVRDASEPTPTATPTSTPSPTPTGSPSSDSGGDSGSNPPPAPTAGTSAAPTPSVPAPSAKPTPKPGGKTSPDPVTVKLEGTADASGKLLLRVGEQAWQEAVAKAKAASADIRLEAASAGGAKEVAVQLPAALLQAAGESGGCSILVDAGMAVVTLPRALLQEHAGLSTGGYVELSVALADPALLDPEARQRLDGHPAYAFSLQANGKKITQFGVHSVKVAVPYTLRPGEDPERIVVWYLGGDGALEVVKNGKYDPASGRVTFKPKHFSLYAVVSAKPAFGDLNVIPWAAGSIEGLAARQMVQGKADGRFDPGGKVTRAEFIQMLMNGLEWTDERAVSTFRDAEPGKWYAQAVATAQQLGIVDGTGEGVFGADKNITRQDIAVMLYRTAQRAGLVGSAPSSQAAPFADQGQIKPYAQEAVAALKAAGMVNGLADGSFAPEAAATRAEAAVMVYRLYSTLE